MAVYRQRKPVQGEQAAQDPDCVTCVLRRKGCEMAQEGSFCTRWRGREPEPKGTDPNKAWEQGEEVDF